MSNRKLTRRAFLASATLAAGAASLKWSWAQTVNTARVVPRKVSPNEKLNVAGIGVGGMGSGDIRSVGQFKDLVNIVALCDVDTSEKQIGEAKAAFPEAKFYTDYRKMLEEMDKEIDAVTVSTPDHTHALAGYMAMKMGKHCRIQKPLTHTIAEARFLTNVYKENPDLVAVMGNQGHSKNGVRELCELVWSGVLGDIREVHSWTNRPIWPQGLKSPLKEQPVPETMQWDLWLGAAPFRPYNKGYAPFKWRGWWDFGCGAIGDMACHIMDPVFWTLHLDKAPRFSLEVVRQEGQTDQCFPQKSVIKFEFPERETPHGKMPPVTVFWYDGGELPPRPEGIPADEQLGDGDNGSLFIGSKAVASCCTYGENPKLHPDSLNKDLKKPDPMLPRVPDENSYLEWIKVCRDKSVAIPDGISYLDYAGPLTEVANMGNVALAVGVGMKLEFDVASMSFTNNKDANKYLSKEYRKPFDFLPL